MQELGVNLGPTRANMVARGPLGVNMYFAKPEKLVFRFDGSTVLRNSTFHRGPALEGLRDAFGSLGHALGGRLGRPWGTPWEALGASGRIFLEDLVAGPWKNRGRTSRKSLQDPR